MADFTTRLPRDLYRAEQVRQLDQIAITQFDIPGFTLMTRAAAAALDALLEHWPQAKQLLVFCGGGNNGGDGYVLAGLAREQGLDAEIIQLSAAEKLQGDAKTALAFAEQRGVPMHAFGDAPALLEQLPEQSVLVDAMLGTGLDRPAGGDYATAIALMNANTQPVLAIDIPSGLCADTGMPLDCALHADLTVTFIAMKQGLLTGLARDYVGHLVFADLDVPPAVFTHPDAPRAGVKRIDIHNSTACLQPRPPASHKGSNGHVLIVGGDLGFGGAVIMAAESASRTGAGLVSVLSRSEHRSAVLSRIPTVMFHGCEDATADPAGLMARATVIVIGPGLGRSDWARDLMQAALAANRRGTPLVVDADALYFLSERRAVDATLARDNWILTPHPGEAATLLETDTASVQADRFAALNTLLQCYGGHCLLKGSGSLLQSITEPELIYLCDEGNPGMGSGGMGDILCGVIAGLVAQGLDSAQALRTAVCIHGEAADIVARQNGTRGMLATDLLQPIQQLVNPEELPV